MSQANFQCSACTHGANFKYKLAAIYLAFYCNCVGGGKREREREEIYIFKNAIAKLLYIPDWKLFIEYTNFYQDNSTMVVLLKVKKKKKFVIYLK